jgi:hypothetical protein
LTKEEPQSRRQASSDRRDGVNDLWKKRQVQIMTYNPAFSERKKIQKK